MVLDTSSSDFSVPMPSEGAWQWFGAFPNEEEVVLSNRQWCWTSQRSSFVEQTMVWHFKEEVLSNEQWCWTLQRRSFVEQAMVLDTSSSDFLVGQWFLSQPVLRDIRRMVVFPAFRGTLGIVVVVTARLQQSFVVEPVCVAVGSRYECAVAEGMPVRD